MTQIGRSFFPIVAEAYTPTLVAGRVLLSPSFSVDATELEGAIFIAPNAGVVTTETITIGGTYVAGDIVVLTFTSNATSRQQWIKRYKYITVTGDTTTTIATALTALIHSDGLSAECPYDATSAAAVITVVAKTNDKHAFRSYKYVASTSGTVTLGAISTTISEGQPADLLDRGVPAANINLASYDTVRIIYQPTVAQPFIDSVGANSEEIYWFGTAGEGAALETLINSL